LVAGEGLTRIATRSAVLRAARPCSDREGPLDLHALSGSIPLHTFVNNTKGRRMPSFRVMVEHRGIEHQRWIDPIPKTCIFQ
jgi:hypothetical protein